MVSRLNTLCKDTIENLIFAFLNFVLKSFMHKFNSNIMVNLSPFQMLSVVILQHYHIHNINTLCKIVKACVNLHCLQHTFHIIQNLSLQSKNYVIFKCSNIVLYNQKHACKIFTYHLLGCIRLVIKIFNL